MTRALTAKLVFVIGAAIVAAPAAAQDATSRVLFTNVRVFNGLDDRLLDAEVLVEDNMIVEVGQIDAAANARLIDGGGRTLLPGLIDSHVHLNITWTGR